MMQQNVGGARRVWACIIADNGVEAEQGFHEIAFEPAVEIVASRFGEQVEQRAQIFRGKAAQPVAEARCFDYFAGGSDAQSAPEIWRRLKRELAQQVGTCVKLSGESVVLFGVHATELRDV